MHLPAISSLPDSECSILRDALRIYDLARAPLPVGNLKSQFLHAVNHCSFLLLTNKLDGFVDLISNHHISILTSLLNSALLGWHTVEPFLSYLPENDPSILSAVVARIEPFQQTDQSGISLLGIDFLVHLREKNVPLPHSYDLSPMLVVITRHDPDWHTWEQYSDTLMHCLDSGTFEYLSNQGPARDFFQLCANEPDWTVFDYRNRTSDETRERAEYYLQQLDGDFSNFSGKHTSIFILLC